VVSFEAHFFQSRIFLIDCIDHERTNKVKQSDQCESYAKDNQSKVSEQAKNDTNHPD
jgi:hypothetical protein